MVSPSSLLLSYFPAQMRPLQRALCCLVPQSHPALRSYRLVFFFFTAHNRIWRGYIIQQVSRFWLISLCGISETLLLLWPDNLGLYLFCNPLKWRKLKCPHPLCAGLAKNIPCLKDLDTTHILFLVASWVIRYCPMTSHPLSARAHSWWTRLVGIFSFAQDTKFVSAEDGPCVNLLSLG